jgi:sterol desaturase/sphingolipid hydroxylase (fatty acid hydroxylase superfamily)
MDEDIKKLMEQTSLKNTLAAYGMTLAFAAVSAVSAMALREMIERITLKVIIGMDLQSAQYIGFRHLSTIGGLVLMVGVWLIGFMVAWHYLEKTRTIRGRIRNGLIWIAGAVAAYFLFATVQYYVVGYWPTLTGAV